MLIDFVLFRKKQSAISKALKSPSAIPQRRKHDDIRRYQAQIAALQGEAEAARRNEVASAKAKIKEIMDTYGLTISDLSAGGKSKNGAPRAAVPAKYRDPATGSEWTGRGRAPLWLAGKDKEQFLIK